MITKANGLVRLRLKKYSFQAKNCWRPLRTFSPCKMGLNLSLHSVLLSYSYIRGKFVPSHCKKANYLCLLIHTSTNILEDRIFCDTQYSNPPCL